MTIPAASRARWWLALAVAMTALKLWLSRGQGIFAIGSAGYDDRLFLELAQHLVRGEWLGPYNELTLAKGPCYSLFVAAVFKIGLPLFLAQHLFYAAASALFVVALRPAITSAGARCAIYALLLWNPMTFDGPTMGRVLRQHIYGPLALLIFAALTALYLRRAAPGRAPWRWVVLLGLASGAFYLTREESIWFAPTMALLAGAYVFGSWKISPTAARRAAGWLGVAFALATVPVLAVCAKNRSHYGWFGTCEFRAGDFADAYGAMLRVRVGPELPFVPVTREAREAMAAVSPAFAAVQAELAKGIARGWAGASASVTGLPPEAGQIGGGWMMWAFREAAAKSGPHESARVMLARYRQIAREINAACDDGRLPAGGRRRGFVPRWQDEWSGPFWHALFEFADFVVRFSRFSGHPPPSTGAPEELQLFRDLTGERLSPPAGELDVMTGAAEYLLNANKANWLHALGKALRPFLLVLVLGALAWLALRVVLAAFRGTWAFPLILALAAWLAAAASIALHAAIEASAFPVLSIGSFAPVYPLLLVLVAACAWDAGAAWRARGTFVPAAPPSGAAAAPVAGEIRWCWLAGAGALLPFLIWHGQFRELFWFGDDLYLVEQMATQGAWGWVPRVFAESFMPLTKTIWSMLVLGTGGSYLAMLWAMWLTHAANTVLFGRVLLRAGFGWWVTLPSVAVFALTAANIEALGWAATFSGLLSVLFLLLALDWIARHPVECGRSFSLRLHLPVALLVAASSCSFVRGVVAGPLAALALLLPALVTGDRPGLARRLPGAAFCLLPALLVAGLIRVYSPGNHHALAGHEGAILEFGSSFFLLNPAQSVLGAPLHPAVILALAGLKVTVVLAALSRSRGRARELLWLLLAYDLGVALLVGIGRFHTGFESSLSSRYQYTSLITTLPFVFAAAEQAWLALPARRRLPRLAVAALLALAGACLAGWPAALRPFVQWRGTEQRALLAQPATDDPDARVPALEIMHVERAKAVVRAFGLH